MARINNPTNFVERTVLTKAVATKNTEDGDKSVLKQYLSENKIDLTKDVRQTDKAIVAHNEFERLDGASTKFTEERNLLFEPVFENYRKECQYLKKFYVGKERELVNWSIPIDNENEINYPAEFEQRATLVEKLYTYNTKLGEDSPLTIFLTNNEINPKTETDNTEEARKKQIESINSKKTSELNREERDNIYNPLWKHTEDIGQFLKNLFPLNPRKLGEWGFDIEETTKQPVARIVTIDSNSKKTISAIKMNTEIENIGKITLIIHRGKTITENPVTLNAENKFKILRGWGTITVENNNKTEKGELKYLGISGLN